MFDFYEKRKLRGILFSKITAGIIFVLGCLLALSAYDRYIAEQGTRVKREERTAELERINQRANALEAKVKWLESERGIEEAIRSQYDVSKHGEDVIVVVDESVPPDGKNGPEIFPLPKEKTLLERLEFW